MLLSVTWSLSIAVITETMAVMYETYVWWTSWLLHTQRINTLCRCAHNSSTVNTQPHCRLMPPFQRTPMNIRINLTLPQTSSNYMFDTDSMGVYICFCATVFDKPCKKVLQLQVQKQNLVQNTQSRSRILGLVDSMSLYNNIGLNPTFIWRSLSRVLLQIHCQKLKPWPTFFSWQSRAPSLHRCHLLPNYFGPCCDLRQVNIVNGGDTVFFDVILSVCLCAYAQRSSQSDQFKTVKATGFKYDTDVPRTVRTWPLKIVWKRGICKNSLGGDIHSHEHLLVMIMWRRMI